MKPDVLDKQKTLDTVFKTIIPPEKQIHVKLHIKDFIAEGDIYREVTLEKIVDEQQIIEATSIKDESVSKEQKKQKGKKTERRKKEKIVTFPDDVEKWLHQVLPKKLNGLLSSATKKLFKACVIDKYKPLNEMWLFRINSIDVGDVKIYSKMVPRNMKTEGKMILVKEFRDGIQDLTVDINIANLAINKKHGKNILKQVLMLAQLETWGPWRYAKLEKVEILG